MTSDIKLPKIRSYILWHFEYNQTVTIGLQPAETFTGACGKGFAWPAMEVPTYLQGYVTYVHYVFLQML